MAQLSLLILHAILAVGLVGAATHAAAQGAATLRRKRSSIHSYRRFVRWTTRFFLAEMMLGLFIYPTFRVQVRAAYLDEVYPLGTAAFEIKEHWLALALLALVSNALLTRHAKEVSTLSAFLSLFVALAVWVALLVGLTLVAIPAPI